MFKTIRKIKQKLCNHDYKCYMTIDEETDIIIMVSECSKCDLREEEEIY